MGQNVPGGIPPGGIASDTPSDMSQWFNQNVMPGSVNDPRVIEQALADNEDPNSTAGIFKALMKSFKALQRGQGESPMVTAALDRGKRFKQFQSQYVPPPPPPPPPPAPTTPAPTPAQAQQDAAQAWIDQTGHSVAGGTSTGGPPPEAAPAPVAAPVTTPVSQTEEQRYQEYRRQQEANAPPPPAPAAQNPWGADNVLDLNDLGNPNLSLTDQYYLAGLAYNQNPNDPAARNNYETWKSTLQQMGVLDSNGQIVQQPAATANGTIPQPGPAAATVAPAQNSPTPQTVEQQYSSSQAAGEPSITQQTPSSPEQVYTYSDPSLKAQAKYPGQYSNEERAKINARAGEPDAMGF